jgi:hypothetical protein
MNGWPSTFRQEGTFVLLQMLRNYARYGQEFLPFRLAFRASSRLGVLLGTRLLLASIYYLKSGYLNHDKS